MNTAAAVFGLIGSLLLIVQPAFALWLRRDTAITRKALDGGRAAGAERGGVRLSGPTEAHPVEASVPQPKAVPLPEAFEADAPQLDSGIDAYRSWQSWSMIAGAGCLAVSYLLAGLAANLI
ncbi:MAG: hypothetical protein U1E42_07110 [Rhodospirillales bacterium]